MTEKEFERLRSLADAGQASVEELKQLEPYRAKRAIILAAGEGTKLKPITINTPKPLIRVNGVRMIDTLIDACIKAEIEDIWVVRGYLSEQFDILRYKYPNIRFIENPAVECCNDTDSIASLWKACKVLDENTYVCDADLVVFNPEIIRKYNYCSNVLCSPTLEWWNDWCLVPDDQHCVDKKVWGGQYKMVGIFYWTKEDALRLRGDIHRAFTELPEGRNLCWEDVPLVSHRGKYRIKMIDCYDPVNPIEIDTWEELKIHDPAYRKVGGE